jgi:uncharacterized protein (DUF1501 family)
MANDQRIVVCIFRRGAAMGTNEIVAHKSIPGVSWLDDYRSANRFPNSHAAIADTIELEGQKGYGLNTRFKAMTNRWNHPSYAMTAFFTLGTPAATRSHFYEQGRIDCGGVNYNFLNSGYMNRFAGLFKPPVATPLDLISLGNAPTRSVIGLVSTYASTKSVVPLLLPEPVALAKKFMKAAPSATNVEAVTGRATAMAMLDTNEGLGSLPVPAQTPSDLNANAPKYPSDSWSQKLRDAARMIIAGVPARYICCDYDGWDHHSDAGGSINTPRGARRHALMMATFSDAIEAFIYDMEQSGNSQRVMLTTMTEFHRTMRENGNFGADHGQSCHAYAWGPTCKSDIVGKVLDYRASSAAFFDAGSYQSPFNNRLLNFSMDYRDFQRLCCEFILGRLLTNDEVTTIWGSGFTSNMTAEQRATIPPQKAA